MFGDDHRDHLDLAVPALAAGPGSLAPCPGQAAPGRHRRRVQIDLSLPTGRCERVGVLMHILGWQVLSSVRGLARLSSALGARLDVDICLPMASSIRLFLLPRRYDDEQHRLGWTSNFR